MRFSRRTEWPGGENSLSVALRSLRARGVAVCDLTVSNPTGAGFVYPPDIFAAPLASPEVLRYAPHPRGLLSAREAVTRYYASKEADISPDNIVLTASTSEGYAYLFRLLLEPGDTVLIPAPSYPLFSYLAGLNDVEAAYYFLRQDNGRWRINFESLEQAVNERTRAVILVSPNNPTGSFITKDEIRQLNAFCAARGLAIICDEVFGDYIFPPHEKEYTTLARNEAVPTFVLGGLSKAVALPQMKLGWIVASGPGKDIAEALTRLEVIADTYLSVNTPVQVAAPLWLEKRHVVRDQIMKRLMVNAAAVSAWAPGAGFTACPVDAGWYAVVRGNFDLPEDEWAVRLLNEKHVYVHPGFFFDFQEDMHVVLSLLTPPETLLRGLQAMVV